MICQILVLGIESIIFVTHKAKSNLFLRIKVTALQEDQMQNLLNTVPDKVLICSKASEGSMPISLYSNRQMNNFFGCDVV